MLISQRTTCKKKDLCGDKTVILNSGVGSLLFVHIKSVFIREIRGYFLLIPATPG